MFIVSIKKNKILTNQGQFSSQEDADTWLASHEGMGTFGQKAQTIKQQVEIFPAVIDEEGNEISPSQYEMQEIYISGYVVEIEDISAKLEQEKINVEAQTFLDSTDWMVIRAMEKGEELSPEFKAERQAARDRIVK